MIWIWVWTEIEFDSTEKKIATLKTAALLKFRINLLNLTEKNINISKKHYCKANIL